MGHCPRAHHLVAEWEKECEGVAEVGSKGHIVVRVKSLEEITRRYAQNSLKAYLEGKKSLNWIIGVIRSSGVRGSRLVEVFERLRAYGDPDRLRIAEEACKEAGWM